DARAKNWKRKCGNRVAGMQRWLRTKPFPVFVVRASEAFRLRVAEPAIPSMEHGEGVGEPDPHQSADRLDGRQALAAEDEAVNGRHLLLLAHLLPPLRLGPQARTHLMPGGERGGQGGSPKRARAASSEATVGD